MRLNCWFTELQERNEESRNLRIRLENLRAENEKLLLEKEQLEKKVTDLRANNDADSEGANQVAGCGLYVPILRVSIRSVTPSTIPGTKHIQVARAGHLLLQGSAWSPVHFALGYRSVITHPTLALFLIHFHPLSSADNRLQILFTQVIEADPTKACYCVVKKNQETSRYEGKTEKQC